MAKKKTAKKKSKTKKISSKKLKRVAGGGRLALDKEGMACAGIGPSR